MTIVGIDADTRRVAYAVLRGGVVSAVHTIERATAKGGVLGNYDRNLRALFRYCAEDGAQVFIEDNYLPMAQKPGEETRNVRTFAALNRVAGELAQEGRRNAIMVEFVHPREWQKEVLGASGGREWVKARSEEVARLHWAQIELSQHECDAISIALYGLSRQNGI